MTARELALRVLTEREKGGWLDNLLKRELRRAGLTGADAALCTRLCCGVLQNQALLDFYLQRHSKIPLSKLEARVLNILRLGAYQALLLDRIPDYAAVSACVDMARAVSNAKTAGFVNAVLRALLRSPLPEPDGPVSQRLSVLYSQPVWQVEEYLDRLGERETEVLLKANNEIPPLWAHVNPLRGTADGVIAALAGEGAAAAPHPWLPDCFALHDAGDIERLEAYKKGLFLIADPAARLAVMAAGPKPGMRVVDGCAAPGGKSFFAAMAMGNRGEIQAFDIHPHKLTLLEKGRARLGLDVVKPALRDAGAFDPALAHSADLVIADLPCSGLGAVRKKPDIRFKTEKAVAGLPALQLKLLSNLSRYVKPGGTLLHVTCTLRREENEDVAGAFLREHPGFASVPFKLPGPAGEAPGGMVTLWPHRDGTDGFFIALYRNTKMKGYPL